MRGGAVTRLQSVLANDDISRWCGIVYSSGWLGALLLAVPILIVVGKPKAASHVLGGWMLAAILAIPFFLLFPVFEPWAANPLYGAAGAPGSGVRFLAAGRPTVALSTIATDLRWATGCCLPSLHVVMPALVSRIAYEHGVRRVGMAYAVIAGITGVAVVYLGRHWVVDVLLAVPFAWGVARLATLWNIGFDLKWPASVRSH